MPFRNWKQEFEDHRAPRVIPWAFIRRAGAVFVGIMAVIAISLWIWPGYLLAKPWQRPGPPPESIALFFSSDLQGHFEPCGCTEQRWGGVARTAGFLKTVTGPATRLVFDVGDMTGGRLYWQRLGWECYLQALGSMKYTAANLGTTEITIDAADIRKIAANSPVPLVSANVLDSATGRPLLNTHHQVLVNNLRVTVVGVVVPGGNHQLGQGLAVADVNESLGSLVPGLTARTDVIILLAACDQSKIRQIARSHPEIDVLLGGRVQQASRRIERIGSCRIAYQANKGQLLGRVDLKIREDGRPDQATCAMILLDNNTPESPQMLQLMRQYNGQLAQINREGGLKALGVSIARSSGGTNTYVGSETCGKCHRKTYAKWKEFSHSRAYQSLVSRKRDNNPGCIRCHVVDFAIKDGFCGIAISPDRTNVQCESCHARASQHVRARTAKMPSHVAKPPPVLRKSCETCHDCIHSPKFSYDAYWERIKHGKDDAHLWKRQPD